MELTDYMVQPDGNGDGDGYGDGYGDGHGYGDGYGNGYGNGDGDGNGYGNGNGDGYGYGNGYGNGDGYGYGYGNGYGYGYGDGYGYGNGYGNGYGYGDGYGYGNGKERAAYLRALLRDKETGNGVLAMWRCNMDSTPRNGGSGAPAEVGRTDTVTGPLKLCTEHALHGTYDPKQWKGERWWIVLLHYPVAWEDDKVGSLKRTYIQDLGKCPF